MLQEKSKGPTTVAGPFRHSLGPAFIHVAIACPGLSSSHLLTLEELSLRQGTLNLCPGLSSGLPV